ncbi:protein of unknown function [Microbacterium sp. Nx66]|nr:protein of unknown function [Microbacterium sp. Nx66]
MDRPAVEERPVADFTDVALGRGWGGCRLGRFGSRFRLRVPGVTVPMIAVASGIRFSR